MAFFPCNNAQSVQDDRQGCLHLGNESSKSPKTILWTDYNGELVMTHGMYETWATMFDGDISVSNSYGQYGGMSIKYYYGLIKNTSDNPYYMQRDLDNGYNPGNNVSFTIGKYGKQYMQLQKNITYAFCISQSTGGGASFSIHPGTFPTA